MKLLHVLVSSLITPIVSDPARATRPRNRPTALQVSNEQVQDRFLRRTSSVERTSVAPLENQDGTRFRGVTTKTRLENEAHNKSSAGADIEPAPSPAPASTQKTSPAPASTERKNASMDREAPSKGEENVRTAAELTGVKPNQHGHTMTTGITLLINLCVVLVFTLVFSVLRLRFPLIYSGNVVFSKIAPLSPDETLFGWLSASLNVTTEMAADSMGLDAALMVEFCNMSCKILAIIGIPMVGIMCPLHYFFGGRGEGIEYLSSITMGNVIVSHRWLYYVHAVIVNLVTLLVIHCVYAAMPAFLRLRYKWLKQMPAPRCVTVLVEGIPKDWRSDAKLRDFFTTMFKPEYISHCFVVKDAHHLRKLFSEQAQHEELLKDYKDQWQAANYLPEDRPMMRERMCIGDRIDAIEYVEKKLMALKPQVEEARLMALKEAEVEGGINCATGFVTFSHRREAEVCHNITAFSSHRNEWIISVPPSPSDVRWADLVVPENRKNAFAVIGYACTLMLFVLFIPIVVVGTNLTRAIHLDFLEPIWSSFAPGLALMAFLAFLPTVLLLIISSFFSLKSEAFAQHRLQKWYFLFMAFFVLLVTVVGRSLVETIENILIHPTLALELLAEQMPKATHFYMDLLMLQWGEQAMNFLRMVPLAKFLFFKTLYEEDDAKRMAEPEDQDFYGIGSRSARFTISLLVGIIFSTLAPLIAICALILFGFMRIYYGYLVVFAETKKADLGGVFFNTQLQHLIMGLGIYNALMIGVLACRCPHGVCSPMLIALPSLAYTIWSYWHFSQNFVWSDLPFSEACLPSAELQASEVSGLHYVQPEFAAPSQRADGSFPDVAERTAKLFNDVAGPFLSRLPGSLGSLGKSPRSGSLSPRS